MSEDTTLKRYQMKMWSRNNQTLYIFHDGTKYQDGKCLSSKRHIIGIKYQMKTTNVQKHVGLLPQDVCIIYDFAFEYKMHTNEIITLHKYIIRPLVMFKKRKKLQYQFKERCFTQSRIASQGIVHYHEV